MFANILKRSLASAANSTIEINTVAIIGAGIMGSGIAQVIAQTGRKVTLVDQNDNILDKAKENIATSLKRIGKKKMGDDKDAISQLVSITLDNISVSKDAMEASSEVNLVIEAIVEDREKKIEFFKELDKVASPSTIFSSNTSSFLIGSISESSNRKDKFAGLHFFSPVPLMKLLEIVKTPELSETTYKTLQKFGKSIGKVCVTSKDTPGFIVNRLLVPYVISACLMAERGDASIEDIDVAMKLGCGYPMGPFELSDHSGIDTFNFVTEGWANDYPEETDFRTSKMIAKLVSEGRLGMKVGKGFYDYPRK